MKKLAVFNQKGGCAKTTSVINIAGYLVKKYQKRVLVIDCDPQANATKTLLMEHEDLEELPTIIDVIEHDMDINEVIVSAKIRTRGNANPKSVGIDVLPTQRGMGAMDMTSEFELKKKLEQLNKEYDYVLLDCPPYINDFTINILAATDYIIVPATVDKDSLDGYGELIDTVNILKQKQINSDLKILGVFLTILSKRESFDLYIYESSKESFGDQFITTAIRRNTYAKQASLFGRPLCYYKPSSEVAKDYEALTDEILSRMEE